MNVLVCSETLPSWIIAGAPKAGTSSLFQWLSDHPQVAAAKEKETYYFVDPGTHMFRQDRNFRDHGIEGYAALFRHAPDDARAIVEATPGYMYSATALRELPRLRSRPSFIFVLREPVAQLQSLYRYFQENWDWIPRSMSFRAFIEASEEGLPLFRTNELAQHAVENSHYETALRRWREACGPDRVHVLLFEDLVSDKLRFMRGVAGRLGLEAGFYDTYGFPAENVTYAARNRLLQRLNIAVRGHLPRGAIYKAMRHLYRAINTAAPQPAAEPDDEWLAGFSKRYQPTLAILETEFGLDLSAWRRAHQARMRHEALPRAARPTVGGQHA